MFHCRDLTPPLCALVALASACTTDGLAALDQGGPTTLHDLQWLTATSGARYLAEILGDHVVLRRLAASDGEPGALATTDGGRVACLTTQSPLGAGELRGAAFSRDGQWLLAAAGTGGANDQIVAWSLAGIDAAPVIADPCVAPHPADRAVDFGHGLIRAFHLHPSYDLAVVTSLDGMARACNLSFGDPLALDCWSQTQIGNAGELDFVRMGGELFPVIAGASAALWTYWDPWGHATVPLKPRNITGDKTISPVVSLRRSPDGTQLLGLGLDGSVYRFADFAVTRVLEPGAVPLRALAWLADGSGYYGVQPTTIELHDLAGPLRRTLALADLGVPADGYLAAVATSPGQHLTVGFNRFDDAGDFVGGSLTR